MRQHLAITVGGALALGLAAPAVAQPDAKRTTYKKFDLKKHAASFNVYKDDIGKLYVTPKIDATIADFTDAPVFFGDGKLFYKQIIVGYSSHPRPEWTREWTLWSPRVRGMPWALLSLTSKELAIHCKRLERRLLTQLSDDQARKIVETAQFFEPFWQREARFLARDDSGTYYFVDKLRDTAGGGGFRVFVGKKGAMKQLPMTNLVNDSAGDIYATKSGELKFITENGKAFWKRGSRRTELVVLPPQDNRYLIYRELGIYGQLGTVCEDM